ncbi:hypothetical protein M409DRAFT_64605 [Zasmidium cellare ATCC 36951]|uniref:Uncharacterized protein n=1 Tax=Zasmidium cellare ATCC 36951 TaxID=1080233 RepID=A0A6A6CWV8_ZASCE|nr:uncharacterized protein M409DRAFT_64605 [Zasmidium cellare ATCC 36951]KAF2170289.1 hypothetical protein M409DRAFT_64605 [Zasmidium cellare ATCC 36951]
MSNEVVLFDLPSRGKPACWSLNPWKARLVLNYKDIPYRTHWIEYPDLRPTFQSYGIPPNPNEVNPNAQYSSPAALLPDGRYIMDSLLIAQEIEKLQPEPSLGLDTDFPKRTQAIVATIQKPLGPIMMPRVPELLLNPRSQKYFYETRAKRWGMPLQDLAKSEQAGEVAWQGAEEGFSQLRELLKENGEGPFIMGNEPTFADFILAGFWRFVERLSVKGDLSERIMGFDARFGEHRRACQPWLERDD